MPVDLFLIVFIYAGRYSQQRDISTPNVSMDEFGFDAIAELSTAAIFFGIHMASAASIQGESDTE
jgi:hypothetical protein